MPAVSCRHFLLKQRVHYFLNALYKSSIVAGGCSSTRFRNCIIPDKNSPQGWDILHQNDTAAALSSLPRQKKGAAAAASEEMIGAGPFSEAPRVITRIIP